MPETRVYDADQVDHYVAELQGQMGALTREITVLREEVALSAVATRDETAERALGRALIQAQTAADRAADEATQEVQRLLDEAYRQGRDMVEQATLECDRILNAARREAGSLVDRARQESDRLVADARRESDSLRHQAARAPGPFENPPYAPPALVQGHGGPRPEAPRTPPPPPPPPPWAPPGPPPEPPGYPPPRLEDLRSSNGGAPSVPRFSGPRPDLAPSSALFAPPPTGPPVIPLDGEAVDRNDGDGAPPRAHGRNAPPDRR